MAEATDGAEKESVRGRDKRVELVVYVLLLHLFHVHVSFSHVCFID